MFSIFNNCSSKKIVRQQGSTSQIVRIRAGYKDAKIPRDLMSRLDKHSVFYPGRIGMLTGVLPIIS